MNSNFEADRFGLYTCIASKDPKINNLIKYYYRKRSYMNKNINFSMLKLNQLDIFLKEYPCQY